MARVFVNRVWKWHFGAGLVETPSDFGAMGERPSHPDLLEDLAARFVANGWSLKWLTREIMLSAAYMQASGAPPAGDESLRFLSRFPRRRLDIEAWRDSLLAATGGLLIGFAVLALWQIRRAVRDLGSSEQRAWRLAQQPASLTTGQPVNQ